MGMGIGKHKVNNFDRAILKLKIQRDTVRIYMKKLEQSLDFERDLAIQLLQNNDREKARCILRKRVALARYLKNTDGQLENLERMICQMENAQIQNKVVDGLKTGSKALERALDVLNIKKLENILESSERGFEKLEEINQLLAGLAIDEDGIDELEEELDKLKEQSSVVVVQTPASVLSADKETKKKIKANFGFDDSSKPSTSANKKSRGRKQSAPSPRTLSPEVRRKEIGVVIHDL